MTAWFDTVFDTGGGNHWKVGYLYAVATHPDARGKGYAGMLLRYADLYLKEEVHCQAVTTVPAEESLHRFFGANGFRECFTHRCIKISSIKGIGTGELEPLSPVQYGQLREELLKGQPHIMYPLDALEKGVEGRVVINFKVCEDGYVRDVKILDGLMPSLDSEAVRLVSSSPKWEPAIMDGKKVSVTYTMPVVFRNINKTMKPATFKGGGMSNFLDWVLSSIKLPQQIVENKISGEIQVSFTITDKGKIEHPSIIKSVHPLLDNEVLRVISSSPVWGPAEKNGSPVPVTCSLPLRFSWDGGKQ